MGAPPLPLGAFAEGVAVGALVLALGGIALWFLSRRTSLDRTGDPRPPPGAFEERRPVPQSTMPPGSVPALELHPIHAPTATPSVPPRLEEPVAERAAPAAAEAKYGSLRISYRILLHIAAQGRPGPEELPTRGQTQLGLIEALSVGQGTIAGPLQRLVVAGALRVERGHAQGVDRRVKIYQLTPLGERIVRDLQSRRRPPSMRSLSRPSQVPLAAGGELPPGAPGGSR